MTRQLRELEVLEVLISQGAIIPCYRCRVAFTMEDVKTGNIENEHLHEKKLGGPDEPGNRRFSHKAKPCHALITHGNGATFAGSSRHKIAKTTQPERIEKFVVNKPPLPARTHEWARCDGCGQTVVGCTCRPASLDRPETIDPGPKCRGCGEFGADCSCPPRQERSSFRRTG